MRFVVIQCAGEKSPDAKPLLASDGTSVEFVAHPEKRPAGLIAAHPDGLINPGHGTWREYVVRLNDTQPDVLTRAAHLYDRAVYRQLVDTLGWKQVFILSAGRGLVRSDFRLPKYDITFRKDNDRPWITRYDNDLFLDFNQMRDCKLTGNDELCFFGGKSYAKLFVQLVGDLPAARKIIYYNTKADMRMPGFDCIRFHPPWRPWTNWHYECAKDFIAATRSEKSSSE